MKNFLQVNGIEKNLDGEPVLKNISFNQQTGTRLAITGASGSGKTSLLKIIAGLIQTDAGSVIFNGEKILGPEEKLMPGHRGISYLSQHFELLNHYRVEEVLEMINRLPQNQSQLIFEVCRISHLLSRKTSALSGGEKQRIALARLLIQTPELLLLDEPFSNLDLNHKNLMQAVIRDLSSSMKITCILVAHDPQDILSWADKILVMYEGEIVQQGRPVDIYEKPVNEYVAALFGKYSLIFPALAAAFGREARAGKKLFTRPEHFIRSIQKPGAVKGRLVSISYFGSYTEYEIAVSGQTLLIRNDGPTAEIGEEVFVSLIVNEAWFI